mmetsp:Transcript_39716/g.123836  ORF Transcript_39716/g.123836 Transcript_39716/m.123836 type:complete len:208 (-) Transcript_39716:159-782(-)
MDNRQAPGGRAGCAVQDPPLPHGGGASRARGLAAPRQERGGAVSVQRPGGDARRPSGAHTEAGEVQRPGGAARRPPGARSEAGEARRPRGRGGRRRGRAPGSAAPGDTTEGGGRGRDPSDRGHEGEGPAGPSCRGEEGGSVQQLSEPEQVEDPRSAAPGEREAPSGCGRQQHALRRVRGDGGDLRRPEVGLQAVPRQLGSGQEGRLG